MSHCSCYRYLENIIYVGYNWESIVVNRLVTSCYMLKKKCIEYCMNFKYFDSHIIGFLSICIFALKNIPVYSLYILPKEFIAQKSYIPLSDIFSAFTAKWPILILVDVKELLDIAFWGSCVWMGCHLFHIALSHFQNDEPCLCNFPSILSKLDRSKMMMMKVNS